MTSRRTFLQLAGAALSGAGTATLSTGTPAGVGAATVPFYGPHQAGIATPRQAHLRVAAFDVAVTGKSALASLLATWSRAAAALARGRPADPADSGETVGLPPSALTVTFGFGPGVFDDRFGLAGSRPAGFGPLPPFAGEQLDPATSGGDLLVQACADDQMVAFHAVRQLADLARGAATLRWSQAGFFPLVQRAGAGTPRNLFGFRDGTANPVPGTLSFSSAVWVDDRSWLRDGTYLCLRRIRMDLAAWDGTTTGAQEAVIGRHKASGAPLSGGTEKTPMDFAARAPGGGFAIPTDSHVRLADEVFNGGATMLRRGYAYDNGVDPATGRPDAGLVFLAYVAGIGAQFVPIQQRLATSDRMNPFITHVASAVFAVPPGAQPGGWVGETLLG